MPEGRSGWSRRGGGGVRYRPASRGAWWRGGWYRRAAARKGAADGRGDITGHGIDAVKEWWPRATLRGPRRDGRGPGELLRQINLRVLPPHEGLAGTVVLRPLQPGRPACAWARAGSPAAVLVQRRHAEILPLTSGGPLGLEPDAEYERPRWRCAAVTLCCSTDGLIERRADSISGRAARRSTRRGRPAGADAGGRTLTESSQRHRRHGDDACHGRSQYPLTAR